MNWFAVILCLGLSTNVVALTSNSKELNVRVKETSQAEAIAAVQRAADENIRKLLIKIDELKSQKSVQVKSEAEIFLDNISNFGSVNPSRRPCEDTPDERVCVPNCRSRYSNGTCGSYASDFCGPEANCSPNCISRYSNGTCGSYGADICY
jgi:hypothetical protein